jgi:uncharacterized protein (TIGR02145 family)
MNESQNLTWADIKEMFVEASRLQKENAEQMKETDRKMKESRAEFDRRMKELQQTVGGWANNFVQTKLRDSERARNLKSITNYQLKIESSVRKFSTPIALFILLFFNFQFSIFNCFAQMYVLPQPNPVPSPMRWQTATFRVDVLNNGVVTYTGHSLEITGSTGFLISISGTPTGNADTIKNMSIAPKTTNSYYFTVMATCNAPQSGGEISYILKNNSGTVLRTEVSPEITITEADIIFGTPTDFEADFASLIKTYERVWAITPSAPQANITHVRVTNTVSSIANFEITKAEYVTDITGATSLGVLSGSEFFLTGNVYTYLFDGNTFLLFGSYTNHFNRLDTIFIKETYIVKTCTLANSVYKIEYGNGTNYCPDPLTYDDPPEVKTSVATMSHSSKNSLTNIYNPTYLGDIGTFILSYENTSIDTRAVVRDLQLKRDMDCVFGYMRAYFSNSAGVSLGLPDIFAITNAAPLLLTVDFSDFDFATYDYSITGLIDADKDGKLNDLPPGTTIYIKIEWQNMTINPSCNHSVYRCGAVWSLSYLDKCNILAGAGNTYHPTAHLGYNPPQNAAINPPTVLPGVQVTLTFSEVSGNPVSNQGWAIYTTGYDHFVIITLPAGFDYDISKPGRFRINGIAATNITKTMVSGRVVLTAQYPDPLSMKNENTYSIDIFFDPNAAIPCDDATDKNFRIEHEWAFKNDPVHYKYACYDTPLNYLIVDTLKCIEMSFDVQRMTFGWTDYDKTERITLATADSYGVDRGVAGPWDNVDFIANIKLKCDTTYTGDTIYNTANEWLVDVGYDAPRPGGCFFFPDPDKAVKIEVWGDWGIFKILKSVYWLEESEIQKITAGNRYTYRIDIMPLVKSGDIQIGDEVKVIYKMQTDENMPNVLTQVNNFTVSTYFDIPIDTCDVPTAMKNFKVVDYAVRSLGGTISGVFHENRYLAYIFNNTTPHMISADIIFPNEYRPNQYATYYEIVFNTLWNINGVGVREYQIFVPAHLSNPIAHHVKYFTSSEMTISHAAGKTTAVVSAPSTDIQSNCMNARAMWHWLVDGAPYCPNIRTYSSKVNYLYYPSSERTDRTGTFSILNGEYFAISTTNKYTTALETSNATSDILGGGTSWNFTLKNLSVWAQTPPPSGVSVDNILPYSWLSVTIPAHVPGSSLSLTDGTSAWSNFIYYGTSGGNSKYWVQLGSLTVPGATPKNFTLSCNSACEPFQADLKFSQSIWRYPTNPDIGFEGDDAPCPNVSTLTLFAKPTPGIVRGTLASPAYNNPSGYFFCYPHDYCATFFNTYNTLLTDPVLKLTLCAGLQLVTIPDPTPPAFIPPYAVRNGVPIVPTIYDPDPAANTWREVTITFPPGTTLEPYTMPGDTIAVYFQLRPICGFENRYTVYSTYMATAPCGNIVSERKNATPLRITGLFVVSNYDIHNFTVTTVPPGHLDLSSATAAATTEVNIAATIELLTFDQTTDPSNLDVLDFVAISIPPKMSITNSNLPFVWYKSQDGSEFYKASLPVLAQNATTPVTVTLAPDDPETWNCDSVAFSMFTGAYYPMTCDVTPCGIDHIHENIKSDTVQVLKNAVDFLTGSITASGVYHSATSEKVAISGKVVHPTAALLEDLKIELCSNRTGAMTAIPGGTLTIPSISAGTAEVSFSLIDVEIPAADMCHLYLLIRKTPAQNQYLCEEAMIPVPPPAYTLDEDEFEVCRGENVTVGNPAITGYTYSWLPTTYIVSPSTGTDAQITVKYPSSVVGNQVLNLTVSRGSCPPVGTSAIVTILDSILPTFSISPITYCVNEVPFDLTLAGSSNNTPAITGTWSPATISTAAAAIGTKTYAFTPTSGRCVKTAKLTVTVNDSITPTFTIPTLYCIDTTPFDLSSALTSDNGIAGTWFPAVISTDAAAAASSPNTYTFTPTHTYCTKTTKIDITVEDCTACPTSVADNCLPGVIYTVTKLAGLCWTSNLQATQYDGCTIDIPWAKQYPGADVDIFGLLYTWYSAVNVPEGDNDTIPELDINGFLQGICPTGYHLPSRAEWNLLLPIPTEDLRSTGYWINPPGPGNDKYGWDSRPAGWYSGATGGKFIDLYGNTGWWAVEDTTKQYAGSFFINYYCDLPQEGQTLKTDGLSVRCILDY